MTPMFGFGVTITVHRQRGTDTWGDPLPDATHQVPDCSVFPRNSDERHDRGTSVVTGLSVLAPFGADVSATDTITIPGYDDADGNPLRWSVEGEVGDWWSPFDAWHPGAEFALSREGADHG